MEALKGYHKALKALTVNGEALKVLGDVLKGDGKAKRF